MMDRFENQVARLVSKGYPALLGMSERRFRLRLAPLVKVVSSLPVKRGAAREDWLPFVVVVADPRVSIDAMFARVEREGKTGGVALQPCAADSFSTIPGVAIPKDWAYVVVGIDRGEATLNVRPEDALMRIRKQRRSPLTMAEGVAVVTHYPAFLKKNHCFSLLASRWGDQRVPAIWIDGKKAPKLGWCWDRNPHTWLGSASCAKRLGGEDGR
jgi:hypothetical protein